MTLRYKTTLTLFIVGLATVVALPSFAQLGGSPQDASKILNSMPSDVFAKVQALARILQQGIRDGKLTEAEVQQGMMSGHLSEKIKALNPEAGHLLDEISDASKQGKGPGEESLIPLLGGLGISPQ